MFTSAFNSIKEYQEIERLELNIKLISSNGEERIERARHLAVTTGIDYETALNYEFSQICRMDSDNKCLSDTNGKPQSILVKIAMAIPVIWELANKIVQIIVNILNTLKQSVNNYSKRKKHN